MAGAGDRSHKPAKRWQDRELIVGRLLAYGPANYQFRVGASESYYLKLKTTHGERLLWGVDLERALATGETQPRVGEMVGARRVGREPISKQPDGSVLYRTQWRVESLPFFADRAKLARRLRDEQLDVSREIKSHPELRSAFLTLRGAQEIAARRIRNPEDQEKFVSLVKEAMASSIRHGEPLPTLKLQKTSREPKEKTRETPSEPGRRDFTR